MRVKTGLNFKYKYDIQFYKENCILYSDYAFRINRQKIIWNYLKIKKKKKCR